MPSVICDTCGCSFEREKWRIKRSKKQFCSHPCYARSLDKQVEVVCDGCGSVFLRNPAEVSRNRSHFCTSECRKLYLGARISATCANCGETVQRTRGEARKSRSVFVCNAECRKAYFQGENHPRWAGGSYVYGPGWQKQKKLALERDNHACRICGKTKEELGREPSVHHINPFRPSRDHGLDNLICLCIKHHGMVERGEIPLP